MTNPNENDAGASGLNEDLAALATGDPRAAEELFPLVYERLRDVARRLVGAGAGQTLQPTALVNEAYLRLAGGDGGDFATRAHFVSVAAIAMRQLLVQRARAKGALKRGGAWRRTAADRVDEAAAGDVTVDELLFVDEALGLLKELHPRQARVVEMRFFGGASVREVAEVLDVSERTVEHDWRAARAWLAARLEASDAQS